MEGFDLEEWLFVLSFLFFFMGGGGAIVAGSNPKIANVVAHTGSLLGGVFGVLASGQVLWLQKTISVTAWTMVSGVVLRFQVDSLSGFFLLLISVLSFAVSIYSLGYVTEYYGKKKIGLLGGGFNFFLLSMAAVVTVDHAFSFLLTWETMSLISFLLVMLEHEKQEVRRAGFVYVVMTHFGTIFIFLTFLTLFFFTGSFDFHVFKQTASQLPEWVKNIVFLMSLIGFGTKAGMIPLHVWLPRAHPAAPSHVSALMSAVMIKTAVYGLLRVSYDFLGGGPAWWGAIILGVGVISCILGVLSSLAENDMKRFLAFSSTENMGIILIGLGTSLIFYTYHYPQLAALALTASLYHAMNHALFKGLLFMGAGAVLYSTHSKNINELGGLIRRMPWTAVFFLMGGMALSALPPLNGFMSEWATFQSLLHLAFEMDHPWWKVAGGLSAAALGLTGALVAGGIVKNFGSAFLGMPRSHSAAQAKEVPMAMRLGMGILTAGIWLLGIWPGMVLQMTKDIVSGYFHAELTGQAILYLPFSGNFTESVSLGAVLITFVLILLFTLLLLRIWVGKSRNQMEETWNCGTPLLPTMEYTGSSYSHPVLIIFGWFYRIRRKVEIHGENPYYPKQIHHHIKIESFIESKLYRPLLPFIVFFSQRLKTIQSGNLQSYLTYMIVMLIVLLLWVR